MIYINAKDLLNSCEYVSSPVDEVCNKIDNSNSKKIIVSGGRGVGKSAVLNSYELKKIKTINPCVLVQFDAVGFFHNRELFDESFAKHYYEIVFSYKLLDFIKLFSSTNNINYPENEFSIIKEYLDHYSSELDHYIKNVYYDDSASIRNYLTTGDIVKEILFKMKTVFSTEKLELAIDRFDWTNANNKLSQEAITAYFDMFDRVFVTSDDEDLQHKDNIDELSKKGYSFIDVDYGKDNHILSQIIENRLRRNNLDVSNLKLLPSAIDSDIYCDLINRTNGNISLILSIVDYTYDMYQWQDGMCNIKEEFDKASQIKIDDNKQLRKMMRSPKLYL